MQQENTKNEEYRQNQLLLRRNSIQNLFNGYAYDFNVKEKVKENGDDLKRRKSPVRRPDSMIG